MIEENFGTGPVITKSGETTAAEAFKDVKLICLYFTMHNCEPCQLFTPIFSELYNEFNSDSK